MPAVKREASSSSVSESKKQRVVRLSPERKAAERLRDLPIDWKPFVDANPELTPARLEEYIRFLILKVLVDDTSIVGVKLSPSGPVDEIWHNHMLLPRHYADVCAILLGEKNALIEHSPRTANSRDRWERYEHTRKLYQRYWGSLPPLVIWPDEPEHKREFQMFIKTLTGQTMAAYVAYDDRVSKLEKVCVDAGNPEPRLIFAGKTLYSEKTIRESKLGPGCTVHLVLNMRGC